MKNFIRVRQNFRCENCGYEVTGDGYTDHCPKCLWGKHVDREIPGDRESDCKGTMEPMSTEFQISNSQFKINYRCTKCGYKFRVRSDKADSREELMKRMV